MCRYVSGAFLRIARNHSDRRLGRIVSVGHAGRSGFLPRFHLSGDGSVHRHLPKHLLQLLQRHAAGPQQPWRFTCQVDDGGLHSHTAGSAVHNGVDLALHILQHVLCGGRTGSAGGVARRGGYRHTGQCDDLPAKIVSRAAHPHGIQSGRHHIGHIVLTRQHHGQRSGPEGLCQRIGTFGNIPAVALQPARLRDVQDQRVILRAALGSKNICHRFGVKPIGTKTVHRLGGNAHKSAFPQDGGGKLYFILRQILRFHAQNPGFFVMRRR